MPVSLFRRPLPVYSEIEFPAKGGAANMLTHGHMCASLEGQAHAHAILVIPWCSRSYRVHLTRVLKVPTRKPPLPRLAPSHHDIEGKRILTARWRNRTRSGTLVEGVTIILKRPRENVDEIGFSYHLAHRASRSSLSVPLAGTYRHTHVCRRQGLLDTMKRMKTDFERRR